MPLLRALAKDIGKDHALAMRLWKSGIHEARILAGLIAVPSLTTEALMETWAKDFDSWDVCDQVCSNLFDKTAHAYGKALEWSRRKEEFVRRAAFVIMAATAVHDKHSPDERFEAFFPSIEAAASDERNFVRKAVNWALRQIGKRNKHLHAQAIAVAQGLRNREEKSARWIAADALRELHSAAVMKRFKPR
jgi:3-methyladenine DNA glycosylase AlkD